jgi:type IV pilus assembly protein PilF
MQNNKLLLTLKTFCVCIVFGLLVGCVTENIDGKQKKSVDKNKQLELHVQMAMGYVENGNRESARLHLTKAFDIDKNSAAATNAMAMLYQLEGEPTLAEEQFKLAVKRDKKYTLAHNNYGVFLYGQKRYTEALAEFETAAADLAYPSRSQALTNVGRAALKLGNNTRAQAALQHAVVLDRNNSDAMIELADLFFQKQEFADAKRYLDAYDAVGQRSPRSLLLGIRLERVFGNRDKEASLALALKNSFPYSKEYLEYKQKIAN